MAWPMQCSLIVHLHGIYSQYTEPGDRLNIKMLSYQYRNFHYKYKMVLRLSLLYNGKDTRKDGLYIDGTQVCLLQYVMLYAEAMRNLHKSWDIYWKKNEYNLQNSCL